MKDRQNIRVLIAEDDYLVGEMIKEMFEEAGNYTVVGKATDGLQAVEMTQATQPDVVLMDIKMPRMDGIEATRRIYESCPTPVVMLTAYETPELVAEASEAGVGAYMTKPPDVREMERVIAIAMARFEDIMKLRQLNAQLKAHNEELDTFDHTVAHDLKNPLSHIVGYAELLEESYKELSDQELRHYLHTIAKNGRKMGSIINELLLLAGVRKTETITLEPLDMGSIVNEALERLTSLIRAHQARIILPESWPVALGYGPWIEEVWENYISNAIKYGGHPPRVELGFTTDHGQSLIRFWVRDNGYGLTAEERARLFSPFVQLDRVRTQGHGLGLSIVRRIVEKLGGQFGVESQIDQGSTFSFTLPVWPDSQHVTSVSQITREL
ncbi:MAG: response regulator [Anaerolineae bacterium]|jgi:signal transduction histidine kinase